MFNKIAYNVHSFAVGGAIVLRRPRRRVLNDDTKDKILFKSLIDKCQPEQKLNSITGDDRRFSSPHAAAKLHVGCSNSFKYNIFQFTSTPSSDGQNFIILPTMSSKCVMDGSAEVNSNS